MPTKTAKKIIKKVKAAPLAPSGLRYSTHNIGATCPPILAGVVFNPKDHEMADGTPVAEKLKEFEERGMIKRLQKNAKVGDVITTGNQTKSLSTGEKNLPK